MSKQKKEVRSIFISDTHLGCKYARAEELVEFLKQYKAENLYLVGDIIDGSRMKNQGIYWIDPFTYVVRTIIGMMKHSDTKIYYAIGNHDEFLKDFKDQAFGGIELDEEFIHETADGRKLLVIHGDYFDSFTKHAKWLYHLGDRAYNVALAMNSWINTVRRKMGLEYWGFSCALKKTVSQARSYVNNFEELVSKYVQSKDCDGAICGHVHTPLISELHGVQYYNCGDWIEHCTALIEDYEGNIELVWYHAPTEATIIIS